MKNTIEFQVPAFLEPVLKQMNIVLTSHDDALKKMMLKISELEKQIEILKSKANEN